jgi:hypothetical protein
MLERGIEEHPFPKSIPKNLNNLFFARLQTKRQPTHQKQAAALRLEKFRKGRGSTPRREREREREREGEREDCVSETF